MGKISKHVEFVSTKIIQAIKEKRFINNNVQLKYLEENNKKSKILIIVFSGCTRSGIKARYNYVRTLKSISENKLFILDDFAEDKRGAYYLGKDCGNEIELACKKLIFKQVENSA